MLTFAWVRCGGQRSGPHDPLEAAHDGPTRAAAVTGGGGLLMSKGQGYHIFSTSLLVQLDVCFAVFSQMFRPLLSYHKAYSYVYVF